LPKSTGTNQLPDRERFEAPIDPKNRVYSGMTRRVAMTDGEYATVSDMPKGNGRPLGKK